MKKLLIIIFMLTASVGYCQSFKMSEPKLEDKKSYNFIVEYREWESVWKYGEDSAYSESQWTYKLEGFHTYEAMIQWLNSGTGWYQDESQRIARLTEEEFIAAYDLVNLEKLDFKFNVEHKTKERQVVKRNEWEDTYWEKAHN